MLTKKTLQQAAMAAAAACTLQANAVAAPTPVALMSTPLLTTPFDGREWSWGARASGSPSTQQWLGSSATFPSEQDGLAGGIGGSSFEPSSWTFTPATIVGPNGLGWPAGGAALSLATLDPAASALRAAPSAAQPVTEQDAAPSALAAMTQAPIDISMKPVSDSAAAPAPRLQPAIYTRTAVTSSYPAQRAPDDRGLGQGDAPNIFGSVALAAGHTPEDAKWRRVADYVPSAGAGPWSPVLAEARRQSARQRLETVNAWVNHAISYATDVANFGVADYWGTARESLTRGRGDCKDYAIAKLELLRALGVPPDDLYLMLVKDLVRRQDHAILAVRLDGKFLILDSGYDGVMDPDDIRDYRPILTFSGARTWVHGFRRTQDVMVASAVTATPAAFVSR